MSWFYLISIVLFHMLILIREPSPTMHHQRVSRRQYAIGNVALASKIALGGVARAHLAIGERAKGAYMITGNMKLVTDAEVRKRILQEFPQIWPPLIRLFTFFRH